MGNCIRNRSQHVPVDDEERATLRAADLDAAPGDRVEDWLGVHRRGPDDPQNLASRGLLIQGLGQFAIARLQLPEQPHVLNGDDGLVGEGLQQLHFRVQESAGLLTRHEDGTHGLALSQHRDHDDASEAEQPPDLPHQLVRGRLLDIGRVHNRPRQDRHAGQGIPVQGPRV
jgi:hypothetical protein